MRKISNKPLYDRGKQLQPKTRPLLRTSTIAFLTFLLASIPALAQGQPFTIPVILSLSGPAAATGVTENQALQIYEKLVNRTGGVRGRPLHFDIHDDQSSPQVSLQLTNAILASNPPVILGSILTATCESMATVLIKNGPVHYCLANAGQTVPGSYEFFTQFTNDAQLAVLVRYFRERGMKKIASIFSIDGGGQDAEHALTAALALPENKDVQLVAHEHFAPGDIGVAAQMTRIKEAAPNVLIAWATGGPAGTLLRNERDAGIDVPTVTSTGT